MARRSDDVPSITSAPSPLSLDVSARTRRYLISMGIRTACFLGAIVTSGTLRYVLLVGALLLPYLAVVVANAGREPVRGAGPSFVPEGPSSLPPAATTAVPPARRDPDQSPDFGRSPPG